MANHQSYLPYMTNSLAIRKEIQRFESVHPSIYAIYDLIELVPDPLLAQQIREHVVCIEGKNSRDLYATNPRIETSEWYSDSTQKVNYFQLTGTEWDLNHLSRVAIEMRGAALLLLLLQLTLMVRWPVSLCSQWSGIEAYLLIMTWLTAFKQTWHDTTEHCHNISCARKEDERRNVSHFSWLGGVWGTS